jgi:hypothetical protein
MSYLVFIIVCQAASMVLPAMNTKTIAALGAGFQPLAFFRRTAGRTKIIHCHAGFLGRTQAQAFFRLNIFYATALYLRVFTRTSAAGLSKTASPFSIMNTSLSGIHIFSLYIMNSCCKRLPFQRHGDIGSRPGISQTQISRVGA